MSESRQFPEWESLYRDGAVTEMPWYHPELDGDLESALKRLGITSGKALDLGTGPGTQALSLAERGFEVTGSDLSTSAVDKAEALARERGLSVRFVQDDILNSQIEGPFEVIFDRGCFHVLPPERRGEYVRVVHGLTAPGGHFFLKCFSTRQPGDLGPYQFDAAQIQSLFGNHFEVQSIDETVYLGQRDPAPRALFCVLAPRAVTPG
ncbi:SAM-dependent methyltransferase [Chondromyces apiculatus]|uniref:Methyltransferase n=1 Tax=Chondromyces apiculatus DSM 436 TaxID=1192034 RepID=A0A017T5V5_9BACT|nr:class I SAM-dependent methyltransferase [Chondromyces apiculatus]EYF04638.1 Methyltransferase [Chondromyces apiculatus DSM 436]